MVNSCKQTKGETLLFNKICDTLSKIRSFLEYNFGGPTPFFIPTPPNATFEHKNISRHFGNKKLGGGD